VASSNSFLFSSFQKKKTPKLPKAPQTELAFTTPIHKQFQYFNNCKKRLQLFKNFY